MITSKVVESTSSRTLQGFVEGHTEPSAVVFTDEMASYKGMARAHTAVKHSAKEFVKGMAHTNSIESHWATLKRGHDGVYHHMSVKHLDRYVTEFEGRHNRRPMDTIDQMRIMVKSAEGKSLRYVDLIADEEV